jgi:hypothetical protein
VTEKRRKDKKNIGIFIETKAVNQKIINQKNDYGKQDKQEFSILKKSYCYNLPQSPCE